MRWPCWLLFGIMSEFWRCIIAIASSPYDSKSYWNRSPKTIAVSEFVDLGREQAAVSQRLCQAEAQHQLLVQVCSEGHGAPAAFVVHAMAASSEWAALHRGRPASRLALSADLAHLCTPSYHTSLSAPTPSRFANTSFHRTAFIRLALSLLPTPLRLLSAQGELSLWTIFHLIPSLYHLLITITRLHALVIFYRLVGGRALSLDNQVPAVNKLARCLELLGRDVETLRSPLSGPAGLSLVKVSAEMELLDEEERRLAARKHEALLLALHRWKEEKGGRRRRR